MAVHDVAGNHEIMYTLSVNRSVSENQIDVVMVRDYGDDPNFMLKPKMTTNEACYQCHADYRGKLTEHTHHPADTAGSLCYNCHMPHQVYSLLTTHVSHRIDIPDVKSSLGK